MLRDATGERREGALDGLGLEEQCTGQRQSLQAEGLSGGLGLVRLRLSILWVTSGRRVQRRGCGGGVRGQRRHDHIMRVRATACTCRRRAVVGACIVRSCRMPRVPREAGGTNIGPHRTFDGHVGVDATAVRRNDRRWCRARLGRDGDICRGTPHR